MCESWLSLHKVAHYLLKELVAIILHSQLMARQARGEREREKKGKKQQKNIFYHAA